MKKTLVNYAVCQFRRIIKCDFAQKVEAQKVEPHLIKRLLKCPYSTHFAHSKFLESAAVLVIVGYFYEVAITSHTLRAA